MSSDLQECQLQAMRLSAAERASLAEYLLASLPDRNHLADVRLLVKEAERQYQPYKQEMSFPGHTPPGQELSLAGYYALEDTSEIKHEYFRGVAYAMAGASARHNLIVANLISSLHAQLRGKHCTVYPGDLRLQVVATGIYTFPDVMVICGDLQYADAREDTVTNPSVIFEVISPSTEHYDRGKKFEHFRTVSTLQEYLLIAQDRLHIEQYIRQEADQWLFVEYSLDQALIPLKEIGCILSVAAVYEKVCLDEGQS